ncbi:MAG: hypothetical protein WDN46_08615 [Methylocella sp.]
MKTIQLLGAIVFLAASMGISYAQSEEPREQSGRSIEEKERPANEKYVPRNNCTRGEPSTTPEGTPSLDTLEICHDD